MFAVSERRSKRHVRYSVVGCHERRVESLLFGSSHHTGHSLHHETVVVVPNAVDDGRKDRQDQVSCVISLVLAILVLDYASVVVRQRFSERFEGYPTLEHFQQLVIYNCYKAQSFEEL